MPGPVTDPLPGELLECYPGLFGGPELPVSVESITEALLDLQVGEDGLDSSGLPFPVHRRSG
jgi:hypothetical protein